MVCTSKYCTELNSVMMMMIRVVFKCGLSEGTAIPYYTRQPQYKTENSSYKLCYMSEVTDRTIHNNRLDIFMLDKSIKLIEIRNNHKYFF
jgi:hypothetical protein